MKCYRMQRIEVDAVRVESADEAKKLRKKYGMVKRGDYILTTSGATMAASRCVPAVEFEATWTWCESEDAAEVPAR